MPADAVEPASEEPGAWGLGGLLPRGRAAAATAVGAVATAAASLAVHGLGAHGLVGVVLCPALVLLTAIDLEHRLLPNAVIVPATALILLIVLVADPRRAVSHLVAGAVFAAVLLVIALIAPGGLGMGDVKLAGMIGVALGWHTVQAVLVTSLASVALGLLLLIREGRSALRRTIPYGPFLALGAMVAYFAS